MTEYWFVATVCNRRGVTLYSSAAYPTRDAAVADAWAAMPKARSCSTARAMKVDAGHWRNTHSDIRWHDRFIA